MAALLRMTSDCSVCSFLIKNQRTDLCGLERTFRQQFGEEFEEVWRKRLQLGEEERRYRVRKLTFEKVTFDTVISNAHTQKQVWNSRERFNLERNIWDMINISTSVFIKSSWGCKEKGECEQEEQTAWWSSLSYWKDGQRKHGHKKTEKAWSEE